MPRLIKGTKQTWTTVDGVSGIRFTANNGNSIFLPAAGYRNGTTVEGANVKGLYWAGTVNTISSDYGKTLSFGSDGSAVTGMSQRQLGLCVRSVRKAPIINPDNSKLVVGDIEDNGRLRIEALQRVWCFRAQSLSRSQSSVVLKEYGG